jgi:acyl carrier protein
MRLARSSVVGSPLAEITAIMREVLQDNGIELLESTRFEDVANWDSMDLVSVVVEVECRFDLQFELAEIDRLTTVRDLLDMIETKRILAAA